MSRTAIIGIVAEPYDATGQSLRDLAFTRQPLEAVLVGA